MSTPGELDTRERADLPVQARLVGIVRELTEEVHPRRKGQVDVRLDKRLREDLGLDPLARNELLRRLQAAFHLSLPPSLAMAPAIRDLLQAIESAAPGLAAPDWSASDTPPPRLGNWSGPPFNARTLVDALAWHAHLHPDRLHIRFLAGDDKIELLTYA
jgi:fatty-acyl-CoA synthase